MDRYTGELGKFRNWVFDLAVAIGQVDRDLADDIRELVKRDNGEINTPLKDNRGINKEKLKNS